MENRFPLIWPYRRDQIAELQKLGCPRDVPWELVKDHEKQALKNHDQSVQRLAERGGLDHLELVAVLTDRTWGEVERLSNIEAVDQLQKILEAHHGK